MLVPVKELLCLVHNKTLPFCIQSVCNLPSQIYYREIFINNYSISIKKEIAMVFYYP